MLEEPPLTMFWLASRTHREFHLHWLLQLATNAKPPLLSGFPYRLSGSTCTKSPHFAGAMKCLLMSCSMVGAFGCLEEEWNGRHRGWISIDRLVGGRSSKTWGAVELCRKCTRGQPGNARRVKTPRKFIAEQRK
jgi:hypothetical protein